MKTKIFHFITMGLCIITCPFTTFAQNSHTMGKFEKTPYNFEKEYSKEEETISVTFFQEPIQKRVPFSKKTDMISVYACNATSDHIQNFITPENITINIKEENKIVDNLCCYVSAGQVGTVNIYDTEIVNFQGYTGLTFKGYTCNNWLQVKGLLVITDKRFYIFYVAGYENVNQKFEEFINTISIRQP